MLFLVTNNLLQKSFIVYLKLGSQKALLWKAMNKVLNET